MRKMLDPAFAEGDRLGVPVILETDAKSKCDKYVHLKTEMKLLLKKIVGFLKCESEAFPSK